MDLNLDWIHMGGVATKLVLAFGLGLLLAANPVSKLVNAGYSRGRQTVYAVALLCVASALVVLVIGDSLARAFGVVGLGGFIRFRSNIQDPRDAAVYFLGIGTGMACGLGHYSVALVGVGVSLAMIAALDRYVGKLREQRDDVALAELFGGRRDAVNVDKD